MVLPKNVGFYYFLVLFNPATMVVQFVVYSFDKKYMDYNRRLKPCYKNEFDSIKKREI